MGILNSIKEKIFGKPAEEPVKTAAATPAVTSNYTPGMVQKASAPVDVEAILEAAVEATGQKLDWRNSIVDMMKALNLDSSLAARKELAADLNYTGSAADGSPEKNVWLHKELMKVLAENGGKVPKELLS
ncbi:MAG: DUF3597 domain-containing protein [Treponema sp.]|nr:DUF3597 domain-containing protein [Treponema sp.]